MPGQGTIPGVRQLSFTTRFGKRREVFGATRAFRISSRWTHNQRRCLGQLPDSRQSARDSRWPTRARLAGAISRTVLPGPRPVYFLIGAGSHVQTPLSTQCAPFLSMTIVAKGAPTACEATVSLASMETRRRATLISSPLLHSGRTRWKRFTLSSIPMTSMPRFRSVSSWPRLSG